MCTQLITLEYEATMGNESLKILLNRVGGKIIYAFTLSVKEEREWCQYRVN